MLGSAVRRVWIAALAGAVALAAGACGGDDGDEESTNTTTASSTSAPSTTLDEETQKEEAATAAYLMYDEAFFKSAADPVNPRLPELQALVTGSQQALVTRNLVEMRANGQAVRLPRGSQARQDLRLVELQTDGSVEITSCEVDDSIVYEVATGVVINDDIVTNLISTTMVNQDDRWKLTFSERRKRWPGIVECEV
jgi:hypothetical protein